MFPETESMKTYLDEEAREEWHKQSDHRKMQDNTQDSEICRGDSETEKGVREGLNFCLSRCRSVFLTVWRKCQCGFIPAHNIA